MIAELLEKFAKNADRYEIGAPETADEFQVYVSLGDCRKARALLRSGGVAQAAPEPAPSAPDRSAASIEADVQTAVLIKLSSTEEDDIDFVLRSLVDSKVDPTFNRGVIAGFRRQLIAVAASEAFLYAVPPSPVAGEWQPIADFVPGHDNPNVLVVDQGSVSEAYYDGENDSWFKAGKNPHDFDFVSSDALYPSHWMPLPEPPASSVSSTTNETEHDPGCQSGDFGPCDCSMSPAHRNSEAG